MKKLILLGIGLGVLLHFATPFYVLGQIRDGALEWNPGKISAHVNFPALRESFKQQFNAQQLIREMAENKEQENKEESALNGWELFMAISDSLLADARADAFIDAYASPAGLIALMNGENPITKAKDAAEEKVAVITEERADADVDFGFTGLNEFTLTVISEVESERNEVDLILSGWLISWQLNHIKLKDPSKLIGGDD